MLELHKCDVGVTHFTIRTANYVYNCTLGKAPTNKNNNNHYYYEANGNIQLAIGVGKESYPRLE